MAREFIIETGVEAEVVSVPDGEKAMHILDMVRQGRHECFDLVLLDIELPRRSGFEVLERCKGWTERPYIAIFSASSSADDRERAELVGADAYLVKPIGSLEVDALIIRLREIMEALIDRPHCSCKLGSARGCGRSRSS